MGKEYIRQSDVISQVEMAIRPLTAHDFNDHLEPEFGGGTGNDYIIAMDELDFASGRASLHIRTRKTSSAIGDTVYVSFGTPSVRWRKTRNLFIYKPDKEHFLEQRIRLKIQTISVIDELMRTYGIRINRTGGTHKLGVETAAGVYTDLFDLPNLNCHNWTTVIVQINNDTDMFDFVQVQDKQFDFSAQKWWDETDVLLEDRITITTNALSADEVSLRIDKVAVTGVER